MLVKSESCVQYSATPMIPIFQIQKSFLILIILYFPMAFDLLKRFSSSSQLLNTLLFYVLDDFFSHLYHFHFILSSYVLVLFKPMFFPLFHYFFFNFSATLLLSPLPKKMRLGSTLLPDFHCTCYCLFLNEYHLILISTYFSDFSPLKHLSLWNWIPLPHVLRHLLLTFTIAPTL